MSSPLIIAGVGSRETPVTVLSSMHTIGDWCRANNVWVRSGHAPGADQAFEDGAQERCIAYIPWVGFERGFVSRAVLRVPSNMKALRGHAESYHPAWERLSDGAKSLMARNSAQVLGERLDSPVRAVVAWTKDGGNTGGTGQALRIAGNKGIPVLNMFRQEYADAEKVCKHLEFLLKIE